MLLPAASHKLKLEKVGERIITIFCFKVSYGNNQAVPSCRAEVGDWSKHKKIRAEGEGYKKQIGKRSVSVRN